MSSVTFGGIRQTEVRTIEQTPWLPTQLSGNHSSPAFKPGATLNYEGSCTDISNKRSLFADYHSICLYFALDYAKDLDLLSTNCCSNIPLRAHCKAAVGQFQSSRNLTVDVQRFAAQKPPRDSQELRDGGSFARPC